MVLSPLLLRDPLGADLLLPSPDKLRAGVGFRTREEGNQDRVRHQAEVTVKWAEDPSQGQTPSKGSSPPPDPWALQVPGRAEAGLTGAQRPPQAGVSVPTPLPDRLLPLS